LQRGCSMSGGSPRWPPACGAALGSHSERHAELAGHAACGAGGCGNGSACNGDGTLALMRNSSVGSVVSNHTEPIPISRSSTAEQDPQYAQLLRYHDEAEKVRNTYFERRFPHWKLEDQVHAAELQLQRAEIQLKGVSAEIAYLDKFGELPAPTLGAPTLAAPNDAAPAMRTDPTSEAAA